MPLDTTTHRTMEESDDQPELAIARWKRDWSARVDRLLGAPKFPLDTCRVLGSEGGPVDVETVGSDEPGAA